MILTEKQINLFEISKDYYLAHCISSDCKMGAGIAVEFQKKFSLRNKLLSFSENDRKHPTCIQINQIFNLITKSKYYCKPTYKTVKLALLKMKEQILNQNITKIAMPKIASGLDRLNWLKVKEIIIEVFQDTDIEILVCYI